MIVTICSGGLDSVTLVAYLAEQGHAQQLVAFDYGQRHRKELEYASAAAQRHNYRFDVVQLARLGPLLSGSALTDARVAVPEGHYADESMKATVVPNRNAIMLSIATGLAVARGAQGVAIGVHAGDHPVYPDCRPEFVDALDAAMRLGTAGFHIKEWTGLLAPFVTSSKADIVCIGAELSVPFEQTWSCYNGAELHCGRCGTCVERREAFELAGVVDPTIYRRAA